MVALADAETVFNSYNAANLEFTTLSAFNDSTFNNSEMLLAFITGLENVI